MKSAEWWSENWHNHELIKAEGKTLLEASAGEAQQNDPGDDASKETNPEERERIATFASIREVHRKGGKSGEGISRPNVTRLVGASGAAQAYQAKIMALKAKLLGYATETRGRKKKHTEVELLNLRDAVEKIKSQMPPGTSDKKAIEASLRRSFKSAGQREGRAYSAETQQRIKTILNLLSTARKLPG